MKQSTVSEKVIKQISGDQKEEGIELVTNAVRKATGVVIDELSNNGIVNSDNFQRIMDKSDVVVAAVTTLAKKQFAELAENISGCLRPISGGEILTLDATDGKDTIVQAHDVFTIWIDPNFKNYGCDVVGTPTEVTSVVVHEMFKDGDFRKIFGGLGDNLNALCLSQAQIINFVKKHRRWLRAENYTTFFLTEVYGALFVVSVRMGYDQEPRVDIFQFEYEFTWCSGSRLFVVVPQQIVVS